MMLMIISLIIVGCTVYKPSCYADKYGTYFCPEENPLYIDPLNYDRGKNCLLYTTNNEEWRWCMDPDNDYIYDPYLHPELEIS